MFKKISLQKKYYWNQQRDFPKISLERKITRPESAPETEVRLRKEKSKFRSSENLKGKKWNESVSVTGRRTERKRTSPLHTCPVSFFFRCLLYFETSRRTGSTDYIWINYCLVFNKSVILYAAFDDNSYDQGSKSPRRIRLEF